MFSLYHFHHQVFACDLFDCVGKLIVGFDFLTSKVIGVSLLTFMASCFSHDNLSVH